MTLQHKYKHKHEAFGVEAQIKSLFNQLYILKNYYMCYKHTLTAALHKTCSTCTTATNKKKTGNL